jgi:hypothetical protein
MVESFSAPLKMVAKCPGDEDTHT